MICIVFHVGHLIFHFGSSEAFLVDNGGPDSSTHASTPACLVCKLRTRAPNTRFLPRTFPGHSFTAVVVHSQLLPPRKKKQDQFRVLGGNAPNQQSSQIHPQKPEQMSSLAFQRLRMDFSGLTEWEARSGSDFQTD